MAKKAMAKAMKTMAKKASPAAPVDERRSPDHEAWLRGVETILPAGDGSTCPQTSMHDPIHDDDDDPGRRRKSKIRNLTTDEIDDVTSTNHCLYDDCDDLTPHVSDVFDSVDEKLLRVGTDSRQDDDDIRPNNTSNNMTITPAIIIIHKDKTVMTENEPPPPSYSNPLCRGGGGKVKAKKKPQAAPKSNPQTTKATQSAKPQTSTSAAKPATPSKATSPASTATTTPTYDDAELTQRHWNVPVRKAADMKLGEDGVCVASKSTYTAKSSVLRGSTAKAAMLVPHDAEVDLPSQLVMVWLTLDGESKQQVRRLVQLGSQPVIYQPPITKGPAVVVEERVSFALELLKDYSANVAEIKQWALKANDIFQTFMNDIVKDTRWKDVRPSKAKPAVDNGVTYAWQAFVRLPASMAPDLFRKSGMLDSKVFVRAFTDHSIPMSAQEYIHIPLKGDSLEEAKRKVSTLADADAYGLYANKKGLYARIKQSDAPRLSPHLCGRDYAQGEKYEILGVPRDCEPGNLFSALAGMEQPWEEISNAQVIYRRGPTWVIKVSKAPPAVVFVLGELVLSVQPCEVNRRQPERKKKEQVQAASWQTPACITPKYTTTTTTTSSAPATAHAAGNATSSSTPHQAPAAGDAKMKDDQKTTEEEEEEDEELVRDEKKHGDRSRSPRGRHRQSAQPAQATSPPPQHDEMAAMRAQLQALQQMMQSMTQQIALLTAKVGAPQTAEP